MDDGADDEVLASVLAACQLQTRLVYNPTYCGHYREPEPQGVPGSAWFHLVDRGICEVESPVLTGPVRLEAGDLLVLPRGSAHTISSGAEIAEDQYSTLLCGEFTFRTGDNALLRALPDLIVVRASQAGAGLRRVAELMVEESHAERFGRGAVIDRLADALFVMMLRHHVEHSPMRRGLLAALSDPRLGRALRAIHAEPGRNWTVASLAAVALQSRTTFSERFTEALGESPYQYLTRWRMTEALNKLRDPRLSVAAIAEQLSYQTESAFRRSFQRVHGFGPGRVRRASRHPAAGPVAERLRPALPSPAARSPCV